MIGYLTGKLVSKKPTQLILDVNDVGYLVNISITTFEKIPQEKEEISLFTYLSVKEDALDLYGFFTLAEKEMFELLISVNGIGPKLAQSILSGIEIQELKEALRLADLSRIIAIPGIGRKTGERLLIELRDKVESVADSFDTITTSTSVKTDAIAALLSLGYNQKTSERIIRKLVESKPEIQIEELVKEALNELNN
ncbi:MAG: Holliday junction branch migration protein RuvA [Ignavibacteria bacterium]|jgi:Holliday junction DNA helicase RuvA